MVGPLDDIAREALEDRAIELCPHSELPAWPPSLLDHLLLFAEAAATPSTNQEEHDA